LLVSILLPALNRARRNAMTVQCASNMRQVAAAMIMYINDHKGVHPPAGAPVLPGLYENGWWFANELVRLRYVPTPGISVYGGPGGPTTGKRFNRDNPFRCPEGVDEDDVNYNAVSFPGGDWPSDPANNGYTVLNDSACAAEGFGIPSWYQLNSRVQTGSNQVPAGSAITPFVWFNTGGQTIATVLDPRYKRTSGLVRRSADLIMMVEAPNPNWHDGADSATYPGNRLKRLAGRHGKKYGPGGSQAWTNMAFFDGHVSMFPTDKFQPQGALGTFRAETVFYTNRQQ
jgi:prepilin-type processing-associated H-X9-DG protein